MNRVIEAAKRFVRDEEGVTAIEYGLIAALIALVVTVGVKTLGVNLNTMYQGIATKIANPAK